MQLAPVSPKSASSNGPSNAGLIARGLPSRRILVVGSDDHVRWVVITAARDIRAEVRSVRSAEQAAGWLSESSADLVVVCGTAAARPPSGILAAVRNGRSATPCLIVSFVHPCLAQVVISDSSGRPASTKVIDFENLARLPACLIAGEDPWRRVD